MTCGDNVRDNGNDNDKASASFVYTMCLAVSLLPFASLARLKQPAQQDLGHLTNLGVDQLLERFDTVIDTFEKTEECQSDLAVHLGLIATLNDMDKALQPSPCSDQILSNGRVSRLIRLVRKVPRIATTEERNEFVVEIPIYFRRLLFQYDGPPTSVRLEAIKLALQSGVLSVLADLMMDASVNDLGGYTKLPGYFRLHPTFRLIQQTFFF